MSFHRRRWPAWLVCLTALVLCGCPQKAAKDSAATGDGSTAEPAAVNLTDQEGRPAPPLRGGAKSFEGRWALYFSPGGQESAEVVLWLFEFAAGPDQQWTGKFLDASRGQMEPEFTRVAVEGDQISFDVKHKRGIANFQGQLVNGVGRGSLSLGPFELAPARLWPTSIDSLAKSAEALPPPGMEIFQQAAAAKEQPMTAALRAAKEAYDSPLALSTYYGVLGQLRRFEPTREQVERISGDFARSAATWGARMKARSRITMAEGLVRNRLFPDLALSLIQEFETDGGADVPAWKDRIHFARTNARVESALLDLRSKDESRRSAARDFLEDPQLTSQHLNFEVLYELARYAADHDETEKAINLYSRIVALPLLELMVKELGPQFGRTAGDPSPRDLLTELWKKSRGNIDGLEAHLSRVYETSLADLMESARKRASPPVAAPTRSVLLELFTGTECPPCVAADIAAWGLQQTYSSKNLIVLQIHQHIPAPDPLANLDGEERYSYYQALGTPWLLVDGIPLQGEQGLLPGGVGGFLEQSEINYLQLRGVVDQRLAMQTGAQVTASAALQNGQLSVSAAATGYPENDAGSLRLRVALVEHQVTYTGTNGIRDHHHVLRAMLGGARGAAVRKGELKYDTAIPLAELRLQIENYLKEFQAGRRVTFPATPLELKSLEIAAWVQHDKTREVLGCVLIPVAGAAPPETAPTVPAEPSPASAAQPANATPPAP